MPDLKKTIFTILKILLAIIITLLFFRTIRYIVPFILAYIFASLIEPLVKYIERKLHIPRKVGTIFSILVVLSSVLSFFGLLIYRLIKEIQNVYQNININVDSITDFFNVIIEK